MVKGNKCSNGVSGNMPAFQAGVVSSNLVYCTISWYGVKVTHQAHNLKLKVRFLLPQLNSGEMEKKVDAIFSDTLIGILDELNHAKVQREDVVNIFQNTQGQYVAVFYQ